MLEPDKDDFLPSGEREIRLYMSYAEANVVRTKLAQILQERAAVSRPRSITGGWAFTIQRDDGSVNDATTQVRQDSNILDRTSDIT